VTFSGRRGRSLGIAALVSLLAATFLLLTPGDESRVRSAGADGYSISAIGHAGLLQLLRDEGMPVVQLRHRRDAYEAGLLVACEPGKFEDAEREAFHRAMQEAPVALLVLPKRSGSADPKKPRWIANSSPLAVDEVDDALDDLLFSQSLAAPSIVRTDAPTGWQSTDLAGGAIPELPGPVQLMARGAARIQPWIECDQGVLLGRVGDLYVLSDPDLLANHGLVRGENAALVLAFLTRIKGSGAIVFDETIHGHRLEPSFFRELGRFPLVLVAVQLLLLFAVLLWTASARFGAAVPSPPPLAAGKAFLVENVVALLNRRGRHGVAVRRFARQRVRAAADRLRVPRGSSDDVCRDWLLARMSDQTLRDELATLLERVGDDLSSAAALAAARRIHELTAAPERQSV
jgi:hypothetical protein